MDSDSDEQLPPSFDAFPSTVAQGIDTHFASQTKPKKKSKSGGFESLNLSPPIFRAIKRKGYQVPTPIQRKTLPLVLAGYDVVAMARTGSGKTAAFLIPMLERLKAHSSIAGARAVILSPTRELALQTFKFCKEFGRFTDVRFAVLVGGDSMESQFEQLANNPDVLVATPGRLMHHLSEVEGMSLRTVEYVVFDEADRLFEMGFAEQLRQILSNLGETRQTLLFSATLPRLLADFAKAGLRDPQIVRLDVDAKISPDLKLSFFTLRHDEKPAALVYLLRDHIPSDQQTLIFTSTKHHVVFLEDLLQKEGFELSVVYGAMDQTARKIHLAKFRARKTMLLLVTDVAARGIDIPLLDNVINYDFPAKPKLFVHRVGRAARAGRVGTAFSFVTSDEMPYLLDLHLFLSKTIQPSPTEEELARSGQELQKRLNESIDGGVTVYGRFPQSVLDYTVEKLRELVQQNTDLTALQRSCVKAFRLYCKTRPPPSAESMKRAKRLPKEGLHPSFREEVGNLEAAVMAFTESLKKFRPKITVLESEGEAARSRNLQTPVAQAVEVMKRKRKVHGPVIDASQQQKSFLDPAVQECLLEDGPKPSINTINTKRKRETGDMNSNRKIPKSYRDEDFYISTVPSNRFVEHGLSVDNTERFNANRIDAEVLDLLPDDEENIQKQKAVYHWDKKHKKFVKLHHGEKLSASGKIKTESGARVNVGNRDMYKRWKARTHMHVSSHGEEDDLSASQRRGFKSRGEHAPNRGRKGHRGTVVPNASARNELRNIEQVQKSRQQKVLRQSWNSVKGPKKGKGKPNMKKQKIRKGKTSR